MSPADQPPENGSAGGQGINNTASENAKVDAQIGVVEGDAVFHKYETIYRVASDDTAEQKYRVARNHLDGGGPRVAEELIGQALNAGLATTEVAYYYALSVLSQRPVNQLGAQELDKLEHAIGTARRFGPDEWTEALDVVKDQVLRALSVGDKNGPSAGDPRIAYDLQGIPQARQEEIFRHLDMIRDGVTQDHLDRWNAENVEAGRLKDDRTERAWKYFHPDPTEPRRATPIPLEHGTLRSVAWTRAVLGLAGFGTAVVLSAVVSGEIAFLLLPVITILLGATTAVWFGSLVTTTKIRRRMKAQHDDLPERLDKLDDSYKSLPEPYKLADELVWRVRYYFSARYIQRRYFSPTRPATLNKKKWAADTKQIQAVLHARLVRLYAFNKVPPATLNWLIRWHAQRTFEQWRADTLADSRKELRTEPMAVLAQCLGTAIAGSGAIVLIAAAQRFGLALTALSMLTVLTGLVACLGITTVLGHRRAMARESVELDQLYEDELREFERWRERLSDRPDDLEMARWLENDKSHLKARAIRRCGLGNRDIIAHIVLTEGQWLAKRARVAHGPPRFSKYTVLVFLLTVNGVRGVVHDLDFETAAIYHERRKAFGYGALTSVNVSENGFQSSKEGQQHLVRLGADVLLTDRTSLVLHRWLQLSLVNQQDIEIMVNNFEGLLDNTIDEDQSYLIDLDFDSSGVAVALHILEAVAAEGPAWIAWERDLRNRRWADWQNSRTRRGELGGPVDPPQIGPPPDQP